MIAAEVDNCTAPDEINQARQSSRHRRSDGDTRLKDLLPP